MQVDFYILNQADKQTRHHFVCRLADKAYQRKHTLYIHTDIEQEAYTLDDLLWTFRDTSFIPHQLVSENVSIQLPSVHIGYTEPASNCDDILINLSTTIPTFAQRFNRIIEVVAEAQKVVSREHYRYYREQGYQPTIHQIRH